MASIYDLSERQIYKLRSIDPHLSAGWQKSLFEVLPLLDRDSQQAIYQRVLEPRGIYYDRENKQFGCQPAKSLRSVLNTIKIDDKDFVTITEHMQEFLLPAEGAVNAEDVADQIEAILSQYDKIYINEETNPRVKYNIRKAFLYEVAKWIDDVEIEVQPGLRRINEQIVKAYIKEVYIKQQIQRWDFRSWDSVDIQSIEDVPDWIKEEAKIRHYFVVETPQFWFLVGQAEKTNQNPYSIRRFLYEDISDDRRYVFLTHIIVPRSLLDNPKVMELLRYCLSRFYTLDRSIGEVVRTFIREAKEFQQQYLRPILRKPLKHDGGDIEQVIYSRMLEYEKQLTILILHKLPKIVREIVKDPNDQDYLFYHLDGLIKQMIESVEDFRLQPATRYSISAELISLRLTCFQLLLRKIRGILSNQMLPEEAKTKEITAPLQILTNQVQKAEEGLIELKEYKEELQDYQQRQETGGLWGKIRREKEPDYTMEDILKEEAEITKDLFFSIIRLEKQNRHLMVYPEYEIYQTFEEDYRHYAFANGIMGISQLPKIIRMSEDRSKFNFSAIRRAVYFDLFKQSQDWDYTA